MNTIKQPVLIIGGYGTVGSLVVKQLNKYLPHVPIVVGGRNGDKAREFASEYENVTGREIDTKQDDLGITDDTAYSCIVSLTNDLSDKPLRYAIRNGIPYSSIATQLNHFGPKISLSTQTINSTVLIQDLSFGGILTTLGAYFSQQYLSVKDINVGALMDENDLGGPASEADTGDFSDMEPGLILKNSEWIVPKGKDVSSTYKFNDGSTFTGASFPSIDAPDLANLTNANNVRVDFGFGQSIGSRQGKNPSTDFIYEIIGTTSSNEEVVERYQVSHDKGQAHLTAVGVSLGIEALLKSYNLKGLRMASQFLTPENVYKRLIEQDCQIIKLDSQPLR